MIRANPSKMSCSETRCHLHGELVISNSLISAASAGLKRKNVGWGSEFMVVTLPYPSELVITIQIR